MSGFENFSGNTAALELEIARKGVVLGIDWTNQAQLRALAREALTSLAKTTHKGVSEDPMSLAKAELFGLAGLMLKTMQASAVEGHQTHGGPIWKAFAHALWEEKNALDEKPAPDSVRH